MAQREKILAWGLNVAFVWVIVMLGSGFELMLARWQMVGAMLAVTPVVLATVLVVRLRANSGPEMCQWVGVNVQSKPRRSCALMRRHRVTRIPRRWATLALWASWR